MFYSGVPGCIVIKQKHTATKLVKSIYDAINTAMIVYGQSERIKREGVDGYNKMYKI